MENKATYVFISLFFLFLISAAHCSFAQSVIVSDGVYSSIENDNRLFSMLDEYPPYVQMKDKYGFIEDCERLYTLDELGYTLYSPDDDAEVHPLIVFMNGGGLVWEEKDSRSMKMLGNHFASRGISFMVIDYRTQALNLLSVTSAGYLAIQDFHTAIKYAKSISNDIKVDPNFIYAGGVSAGAVSAIHTAAMQSDEIEYVQSALWDERYGCLDCEGVADFDSKVKGVINISGGIIDMEILKDEDFRLIQFVGVDDRIVPATNGKPFVDLITSDRSSNIIIDLFSNGLRKKFAEFVVDFFDVPNLHGALDIDVNRHDFPNIELETHTFSFHDHRLLLSRNGNRPMKTFSEITESITKFIKKDTKVERPQVSLPPYAIANKKIKISAPKASKYRWSVDGEPLPESNDRNFEYIFSDVGNAKVALSVQNKFGEWSEPVIKNLEVKPKETISEKASAITKNPWAWIFILGALAGLIFILVNNKKSKRAFLLVLTISASTALHSSAQSRYGLNALEGEVYQVRIFLNDSTYTWTSDELEKQNEFIDTANEWLVGQANVHDDILSINYSVVDSLIYNHDIDHDIYNSFSSIVKLDKQDFEKNYVPRKYRQNYHVVFISPRDGRSYAVHKHRWSADGVGHTVVFGQNRSDSQMPLVYAHEILHLYGANDFYTEDGNRVKTYYKIRKLFPKEVMLTTFQPLEEAQICGYTAWLVGWEEEWKAWYGRVD